MLPALNSSGVEFQTGTGPRGNDPAVSKERVGNYKAIMGGSGAGKKKKKSEGKEGAVSEVRRGREGSHGLAKAVLIP